MMLIQTHIIALISEARIDKPETIVYAEQIGIRERRSLEPVHFHEPDSTTCGVCGKSGFMVWTDSRDKFTAHPFRCGELPAVVINL